MKKWLILGLVVVVFIALAAKTASTHEWVRPDNVGGGGGTGTLDCTNVNATAIDAARADCAAGYTVTGGGCDSVDSEAIESFFVNDSSYQCSLTAGAGKNIEAFARCCRII